MSRLRGWSTVVTLTASVDWRLTLWASTRCTHTVRSTLDNDIHDSRCTSAHAIKWAWFKVQIYSWFIQILTWLCDNLFKTRVADRQMYRRTDKVITATLHLRFAARVNHIQLNSAIGSCAVAAMYKIWFNIVSEFHYQLVHQWLLHHQILTAQWLS